MKRVWDSHFKKDTKNYLATYIINSIVSYLPEDGFLLSRNTLHYTIEYTKGVAIGCYYPPVPLHHTGLPCTK
jgi:hypothetical protein